MQETQQYLYETEAWTASWTLMSVSQQAKNKQKSAVLAGVLDTDAQWEIWLQLHNDENIQKARNTFRGLSVQMPYDKSHWKATVSQCKQHCQ